ncbi:hypothetical protein IE044AEMC_01842 [Enterococcus faecalis]|nr:hypothetical protein A4V06_05400 [Enterococcus faecalis]EEU17298.1 predicted protein [Enterococcus faecalis ATCC 4200]EFU15708.1 hypothetical protein HMPREF9518_00444 [Enterococcus faecalis TX1342]EOJ91106.1 hypothetical protein WOI_00969 [Enterococcus faecalis EnGen0368]ASU27212.1 hypothetical protein ADH73_14855 [Enterococcus faecalis]
MQKKNEKGIKRVKKNLHQKLKKSARFIIGDPEQNRETGKTRSLFLFVFILYLLSIVLAYVL